MRLTHTYLIFPDQDIKIAVRSGKVAKTPASVISTACPSCQGDMGRKELCKECGKELRMRKPCTVLRFPGGRNKD